MHLLQPVPVRVVLHFRAVDAVPQLHDASGVAVERETHAAHHLRPGAAATSHQEPVHFVAGGRQREEAVGEALAVGKRGRQRHCVERRAARVERVQRGALAISHMQPSGGTFDR